MKLNDVNWGALEHAYGNAGDIPGYLEKIATNDSKAVAKIAERIAHQGWIEPDIALATVPLLLACIDSCSGNTKAKLINLLSDLVCAGSHEHFVGQRLNGPIFQNLIAKNSQVAAVHTALVNQDVGIDKCLQDSNATVRAAAAQFLALTNNRTADLMTCITREKNTVAKADMLIALGWLANSDDESVQAVLANYLNDSHLKDNHLNDKQAVIRFGAAIGLAYTAPLTQSVLTPLYAAMEFGIVKNSVWYRGQFFQIVINQLIQRAYTDNSGELLLNAFAHAPRPAQFDVVANLLRMYFSQEFNSTVKPPVLEGLSDHQKNILQLIVKYEVGGSTIEKLLSALGISASPPGVSHYLGIPLPTEMTDDTVIDFEGTSESVGAAIKRCCIAKTAHEVDENRVKYLAETIAARTEIGHTMDMAFSLSKSQCKDKHLLVLYFLLAYGKKIEAVLAQKIHGVLESGGTQYYYYLADKNTYWCTGDQFLLITYWTALHHINPDYPVPDTVEKHAVQNVPRSLSTAYQFHGVRLHAHYHASVWYQEAFYACKRRWPDLIMDSQVKEYGWDQEAFV